MSDEIQEIFDVKGPSGKTLVVGVGRDNRLYVNGEPVVTKLSLNLWVSAAIIVAGASTLVLAIVEIGRAAGAWS